MPALLLPSILMIALLLQPSTAPVTAPAPDGAADALAADVMRASGADAWPRVTRIRFTFNVERDGKRVASVKHDWDVRAGTDTVSWGDKTATVDVRKSDHTEDLQKQAYGRFINDSYWLLAPLKVMDGGVRRSIGPSETIDGKSYDRLHLSFENVGLTPSDQYDLWVDPQTKLVRHWDYIPAKGNPRRFTWDDYREFNGLKLSTKHTSSGATISFTDIEVTTE